MHNISILLDEYIYISKFLNYNFIINDDKYF
jgi:hypothetical protein